MSDPSGEYRVGRMSLPQLDLAIDWAAAEGWNPGLSDAACFHAIDPNGFFSGVLDGRMIASGSVPAYDSQFAFVGLYIVAPDYRGQGFGLSLTEAMLAYAGDRNVGLDGVEAMAERYKRLGFRSAHRTVRHGFTPSRMKAVAAEDRSAGACPLRRACGLRSPAFLRAAREFPQALDRPTSGGGPGIRRCRRA